MNECQAFVHADRTLPQKAGNHDGSSWISGHRKSPTPTGTGGGLFSGRLTAAPRPQVADAVYCFWQQRQSGQIFGAAKMIQQAALFQLLCMGCGPWWPLPFALEDVWLNYFLAVQLAVQVMETAKASHPRAEGAEGVPPMRKLRHLLQAPLWQAQAADAFSAAGPPRDSSELLGPQAEATPGWHLCPLELGASRLSSSSGPGRFFEVSRVRGGRLRLQACQSGVVYEIPTRLQRHMRRGDGPPSRDLGRLLVLPLSDLSFHLSVAVRTWFGGALLLVHHFLGGPKNVTILLADHCEVKDGLNLSRAQRYGGNHGGFGVRQRLGKLGPLFSGLSSVPPIWLSGGERVRGVELSFSSTVWGFPPVGTAHGRRSEYDCSGRFCFGLRRLSASNNPVITLRSPLDQWLTPPRATSDADGPLKLFLVQRSRDLSRRLVAPERLVKLWSSPRRGRPFGRVRSVLWRPETQSILAQARTLAHADMLVAVTGQACGLGVFLRRKRILLEFSPALAGSYGCRWGWDMNPTTEVGQIARLGELHHHCVMAAAVGVAAGTPADAQRSALLALAARSAGDLHTRAEASLTWRTAAKVIAPTGRLRRVLQQAAELVRRQRRLEAAEKTEKDGVQMDCILMHVLLQMGITPLTFDGYAIKSVKLHQAQQHQLARVLLLPQGLHQGSPVGQNEVFCPKCGNDTVVRVPILVDQANTWVPRESPDKEGRRSIFVPRQDGVPTVLNSGRKLRTKGTVFSMPKPQGGRVWKPIFAEDVGADGWFQPQQQPADRGRARPALGGERRAPQQLSEELFGTGDRSVDARRDWPPSTPLTDSDDEFHIESCSPLAYRARSRFIQRNGRRRLRRTVDVMIEESRIRMLELKVEPRLREQFQPIHLAAHLGDHQALCFLLLDGADVEQKTSKGKSALDLAQAANQQGSHDQVISMLTLRALPSWEDRLLEQLDVSR
ncbi:unnamed protein product [Durusdinium trenchii]|uniref:Nin one binding (NOB1) Zn-ribbon-like domain-containing protein n=1 Tax=Durusdinium trenchii TaxID=1381693 RepID=A0ABP0QRH4_9DINO